MVPRADDVAKSVIANFFARIEAAVQQDIYPQIETAMEIHDYSEIERLSKALGHLPDLKNDLVGKILGTWLAVLKQYGYSEFMISEEQPLPQQQKKVKPVHVPNRLQKGVINRAMVFRAIVTTQKQRTNREIAKELLRMLYGESPVSAELLLDTADRVAKWKMVIGQGFTALIKGEVIRETDLLIDALSILGDKERNKDVLSFYQEMIREHGELTVGRFMQLLFPRKARLAQAQAGNVEPLLIDFGYMAEIILGSRLTDVKVQQRIGSEILSRNGISNFGMFITPDICADPVDWQGQLRQSYLMAVEERKHRIGVVGESEAPIGKQECEATYMLINRVFDGMETQAAPNFINVRLFLALVKFVRTRGGGQTDILKMILVPSRKIVLDACRTVLTQGDLLSRED